MKEMPGYQKLQDRYGPRGFVVIAFKFDTMTDMEDPAQVSQEIGVPIRSPVASGEAKNKFGGIEGLPTTNAFTIARAFCARRLSASSIRM